MYHTYKPFVADDVIDTVRNTHSFAIRREVVVEHGDRFYTPFTSRLAEKPDKLAALAVGEDYGQPPYSEIKPLLLEV